MKKYTSFLSLSISILMLCMVFVSMPVMATSSIAEGENYIDIEAPLVPTDTEFITPLAISPLTGNVGKLNAFFNVGQTSATTNMVIFDFRDSTLPTGAKITKVELSSQRTAVPGMIYYAQIGKGSTTTTFNWAPNISWASTVNTNYFNNQNPYDYWALRFYATRTITPPDYGAGATVSSAILRVYWK